MALVSGDDAEAESFTPLFLGLGTVDLSRDPADLEGLQMVRVFAGYSGWGSGQLEAEMEVARGSPSMPRWGDVSSVHPSSCGGPSSFARVASWQMLGRLFPDDPALN